MHLRCYIEEVDKINLDYTARRPHHLQLRSQASSIVSKHTPEQLSARILENRINKFHASCQLLVRSFIVNYVLIFEWWLRSNRPFHFVLGIRAFLRPLGCFLAENDKV